MYIINNIIKLQCISRFDFEKKAKTNTSEMAGIGSEKEAFSFEHTSLYYTQYYVMEVKLGFYINQRPFHLKRQQHVSIPKKIPHWINANKNFQFLIT
jgi:quercetin dioxygenase-like cupin family protein